MANRLCPERSEGACADVEEVCVKEMGWGSVKGEAESRCDVTFGDTCFGSLQGPWAVVNLTEKDFSLRVRREETISLG